MNLGPHAVFIIVSYAIAAAVIAGLIGWVLMDYRAQLRALAELETRGITRRSERPRSTEKIA